MSELYTPSLGRVFRPHLPRELFSSIAIELNIVVHEHRFKKYDSIITETNTRNFF